MNGDLAMSTLPRRSVVVLVVLMQGMVSSAADVGKLQQMAEDLATSIAEGNQLQSEAEARELGTFVNRIWARRQNDVVDLAIALFEQGLKALERGDHDQAENQLLAAVEVRKALPPSVGGRAHSIPACDRRVV